MMLVWWWLFSVSVSWGVEVGAPSICSPQPSVFRSPSSEVQNQARETSFSFFGFSDGCQAFRERSSDGFREAMVYLKKRLREEDLDVEVFPVIFAQLANESGYGTSYAAQTYNNLGGWYQSGHTSGYRTFGSTREFIDEFIAYVNGPKFSGQCVEKKPSILSRFSRAKTYVKCILSGAPDWQECVLSNRTSGKNCYCASACSELYRLPRYDSEANLPDYGRPYGVWKNYQIGLALLDDSEDCGFRIEDSIVNPRTTVVVTGNRGSLRAAPRLISVAEARAGALPGCQPDEPWPPVGRACAQASRRDTFCSGKYSCYCQYNSARQLVSNCYDVGR